MTLRRRFFLFLIFMPGCIGIISIALCQLAISGQFADIVYVGQRIEKSDPLNEETVFEYISPANAVVLQGVCRSDVVKAGATVMLRALDFRSQDVDYSKWETVIRQTDTYLRHALSCLPTDGNLWLRYAMVQQVIGERKEDIKSLIAISQRLAPAEAEVIFARLRLWNRLSTNTITYSQSLLKNDLIVACQSDPSRLKRMAFSVAVKRVLPGLVSNHCMDMLLS